MKNLFKFIKKSLGFEKKVAMFTTQLVFRDTREKKDVLTISCTFYIGEFGTRIVKYDYDKYIANQYKLTPQRHCYFHDVVNPFLKKTGNFKTDDDVWNYFFPNIKTHNTLKPKKSDGSNVIEFPNKR